jgi:hypothetical protein
MNSLAAVQALVDASVDFVIVGGWSAILHGSWQPTRDLDVCFSRPHRASARLHLRGAPRI